MFVNTSAQATLLHVVPENNKTTTTIQTRSEEKLKEAKVKQMFPL